MEFKPLIIETPRLLLKGLSPKDMNFIFSHYPKHKIMKVLGHRTDEEYINEENKHRNGYSAYNRSFLLFLLNHKESNSIIGRCGLHNWNEMHKRAEVGYAMTDENYKRKGLMTEAVNAVLDYGFNTLQLNRIEALVAKDNAPSLRILEKQGFVKEGLLRNHYWVNNQFEDSVMFSKLQTEHIK